MSTWRTIGILSTAVMLVCHAAPAVSSSQARAGATERMKGLTAVQGIRVGHHTLAERPTGCTVVLVDGEGAVGGVSQRGGAPGTRETDLLRTSTLVERVNAVVLSGGSAFGLDAAQGVMKYLEERGIGFKTGSGVVPIVPAAILFDLGFGGDARIRPTAECGQMAAAAATDGAVVEGNVGAGAGATVGKMGGAGRAGGRAGRGGPMKAGVGSASIALPDGLVVAALAAVNASGDIIDPQTGQVVAGVRGADGALADVRRLLRSGGSGAPGPRAGENTTIAVVATNARLTKEQVNRVAIMADDGLARAINPSHTPGDGDTVFALATGTLQSPANVTIVGALAAEALAEAIVRAAAMATQSAGVPSARDLGTVPARFK